MVRINKETPNKKGKRVLLGYLGDLKIWGPGLKITPSLESTPEKSIDFLGVSCSNKVTQY